MSALRSAVVLLSLAIPLFASGTRAGAQPVGSAPKAAVRDTTAVLRGTVVDSAGRPIDGAEVRELTSGNSNRTGASGRFSIGSLPAGNVRVRVRLPGMRPLDTVLVVLPAAVRDVAFTMRRLPAVLDTMRVIAAADCPSRTLEGFECRRRVGIGAFRDSAELASLGAIELGDLVWGVAGIRARQEGLARTIESTAGWRCLVTFYDGKLPVSNALPRLMQPDQIVALEYFAEPRDVPEWYKSQARAEMEPGQRATANSRYDPKGGGGYTPGRAAQPPRNCSLLVLWTKKAPRFDTRRDESDGVRDARRRRFLADSLMAKADSSRR